MRRILARLVREVRRILKGRISRADAARRVEELLGRLDQPTPHLRRISRVVIYGSYARGAFRVGDVDLAIDYESGAEMLDRAATDAGVARLTTALRAVEALAPALASDTRPRVSTLAADAVRLRRQLADGLPAVSAIYDTLREQPKPGSSTARVNDNELARLETELQNAVEAFDVALEASVPFPPGTPSLAPVENLKRMIEELIVGDDRLSIYHQGADMPYDRAVANPGGLWAWHLLWERGDSIDVALVRMHAIKPDRRAGRAFRSGQTGHEFKP